MFKTRRGQVVKIKKGSGYLQPKFGRIINFPGGALGIEVKDTLGLTSFVHPWEVEPATKKEAHEFVDTESFWKDPLYLVKKFNLKGKDRKTLLEAQEEGRRAAQRRRTK